MEGGMPEADGINWTINISQAGRIQDGSKRMGKFSGRGLAEKSMDTEKNKAEKLKWMKKKCHKEGGFWECLQESRVGL